METYVKTLKKKKKYKKPILIEGLPGIGNVGRVAAGYLVSELKMEKIAEMYSPHFLPLVLLHEDSVAHMLRCEFYHHKAKKRDLIVLTGDTQSISPEGHYEISSTILDFAEEIGVKDVITLGGFAEGQEVDEPRVIGAVSDKKLLKRYGKYGIDFGKEHQIGTIVGASGLILGMGKNRGMDGLCLMGETYGLPLMTDPKAADQVLQVLSEILDIDVDLAKLEKTIKEMESRIQKTDKIHKKMLEQLSKSTKDEQMRYIG